MASLTTRTEFEMFQASSIQADSIHCNANKKYKTIITN